MRHKSPALDDTLVLNTRGKLGRSGIRKERNAALEKFKIFRVRRKSQANGNEQRFFEDFQSGRPVAPPDHMEAPRELFSNQPTSISNINRQGRNQFSSNNNFPLSTQDQVPRFNQQSDNSLSSGNFQNGGNLNQFSSSLFSNNNQAFNSQTFNPVNTRNKQFNQIRNNGQNSFNQNRDPKTFTSSLNSQNTRFNNQGSNKNQNNIRTNSFSTPQKSSVRNSNPISNTQISNSNQNIGTIRQNSNFQPTNQRNQPNNIRNTNIIVTTQPPRIQGNQIQSNSGNQPQTNSRNTNSFVTPQPSSIQNINQNTRAPRNRGITNQRLNPPQASSQFVSGRTSSNSDQGRQGRTNSNSDKPRQGRDGHDNGYSAPTEDNDNGYSAPADAPAEYGAPDEEPQAEYSEPIAILKLTGLDTAPLPSFNYMYKTANDINVMAEGELRTVCDEDVSVMRGSYEYIGPDGNTYKVEWYADETGFHPTLDHLPKPVEPDHPEVAAAVAAQIAFAGPPPPAPANPCPPKISPLPSYDSPLPSYDSKI